MTQKSFRGTALALPALILATFPGCFPGSYRGQGTAMGGVGGAVLGAAVGDRSGNAGLGALAGGMGGAMLGNAIGGSIDEDLAHSQAVVREQLGREIRGQVSVPDVIAMTQANVGSDVIMTHIRAQGSQTPTTDDIITLAQAGVDNQVIKAMQNSRAATVPVARQGPPVIVEEHVYVPGYYGPPRPHYWRPRPPRRRGVHWGFSVGR